MCIRDRAFTDELTQMTRERVARDPVILANVSPPARNSITCRLGSVHVSGRLVLEMNFLIRCIRSVFAAVVKGSMYVL